MDKITTKQGEVLINLIRELEINDFFIETSNLNLKSTELSNFKSEYIAGNTHHDFYRRLEVYINSITESNVNNLPPNQQNVNYKLNVIKITINGLKKKLGNKVIVFITTLVVGIVLFLTLFLLDFGAEDIKNNNYTSLIALAFPGVLSVFQSAYNFKNYLDLKSKIGIYQKIIEYTKEVKANATQEELEHILDKVLKEIL